MAIDAADLAAIREWVGSTPDDADLEVRWDRHGDAYRVALEVLRGRLADAEQRAEVNVDGFMREGAPSAEALKTMRARISQLEGLAAGSDDDDGSDDVGGLTTGRFVRRFPGRQRTAGTSRLV